MIGSGLLLLTTLSSCVLSLPVTSSQLENEDVKVMKCIVEVLTDVLSRPQLMPVSQECLVTLKTDDRLIKILRHHKFLKELQEIAVQGDHGRAQLQRDVGTPTFVTQTTHPADIIADRSMLEALGGPGERSILSQEKRTGNGDGKEGGNDSSEGGEPRDDNGAQEVEVNRADDKSPGSHASESVDKWSKAKAEKREEEEGEEEEGEEEEGEEEEGEEASDEKRANSEDSEEGHFMRDEQGGESEERRDAHRNKKSGEEGDDEEDIKSALFSHKHKNGEEEEQEVKRGSSESLKRWTKRAKSLSLKRKAAGREAQQEVAHHSKEIMEEDDGEEKRNIQRSPEEKELQMIARRTPQERRVSEEEGSASRKSEEPEIERLAAIESELESVAQKLHDLRRG